MKAKKQTERLVATVTFKVFENEKEEGLFSTELTTPKGVLEFAAINLLERHLYKIKAGTPRPPAKASK